MRLVLLVRDSRYHQWRYSAVLLFRGTTGTPLRHVFSDGYGQILVTVESAREDYGASVPS